jgi:hypothetical protein
VREAIYSIRHCSSLWSKIKTLSARLTRLEHGLTWKILYSGCLVSLDQAKTRIGLTERYELEILEEEWTGRQEILIIRERIFN